MGKGEKSHLRHITFTSSVITITVGIQGNILEKDQDWLKGSVNVTGIQDNKEKKKHNSTKSSLPVQMYDPG